jgi:hypothetical protein
VEGLAKYDFVIEHWPGKSNPADALSRRPDYRPGDDKLGDQYLPSLHFKLHSAATPMVALLGPRSQGLANKGMRKERRLRTGKEPASTETSVKTAIPLESPTQHFDPLIRGREGLRQPRTDEMSGLTCASVKTAIPLGLPICKSHRPQPNRDGVPVVSRGLKPVTGTVVCRLHVPRILA